LAAVKANVSKNATLNSSKNATTLTVTHRGTHVNASANATINSSKLAVANHTSTEKVWIQPANANEKKASHPKQHHNLVAKIRDFKVEDQNQMLKQE
jgi:hypothetical protein